MNHIRKERKGNWKRQKQNTLFNYENKNWKKKASQNGKLKILCFLTSKLYK